MKDARAFMEHEGFQCSEQKSQSFNESGDLKDYLYCERSDGSDFDAVHRRWQIALIEKDGRIQTIEAYTGLVGP